MKKSKQYTPDYFEIEEEASFDEVVHEIYYGEKIEQLDSDTYL